MYGLLVSEYLYLPAAAESTCWAWSKCWWPREGGKSLFPLKVDLCEAVDPGKLHECFPEKTLCPKSNKSSKWCKDGDQIEAHTA